MNHSQCYGFLLEHLDDYDESGVSMPTASCSEFVQKMMYVSKGEFYGIIKFGLLICYLSIGVRVKSRGNG